MTLGNVSTSLAPTGASVCPASRETAPTAQVTVFLDHPLNRSYRQLLGRNSLYIYYFIKKSEVSICNISIIRYNYVKQKRHIPLVPSIVDYDECMDGEEHCDYKTKMCENTVGSYHCVCKPGYERVGNSEECTSKYKTN